MKKNDILLRALRLRGGRIFWFLCALLLFLTVLLSDSYQATEQIRRKTAFGFHRASLMNADPACISKLKNHRAVGKCGQMDVYGTVTDAAGNPVVSFGSVDKDFRSLERQTFLMGRYPASADEIAMESTALTLLDIPLKTGQVVTLSLQYDGQKSPELKSFTLCGILRPYTMKWNSGDYPLAGALILPQKAGATHHLFFDASYEDRSQMSELEPWLAATGSYENQLLYNEYTYPSSSDGLLTKHFSVAAVTMILFFLMLVHLLTVSGSMKRQGLILYQMGVPLKKLRNTIFRNGIRLLLWAELAGLAGYIFLMLVIKAAAGALKADWVICWKVPGIFYSLLLTGLLMLTETLILYKSAAFPQAPKRTELIMRKASEDVISRKTLIRRFHRTWHRHFLYTLILFAVSCTSLFAAGDAVIRKYQNARNHQFFAAYAWRSSSVRNGMHNNQLEAVKTICGPENVCYATVGDESILMDTGSDQHTAYLTALGKAALQNVSDDGQSISVKLIGVEAGSTYESYILKEYGKIAEISEGSTEAFRSGKLAFVYLPEIYESKDTCHTVNESVLTSAGSDKNIRKPSLTSGSSVSLVSEEQSLTISLGVFSAFPGGFSTWQDEYTTPGTVFVTENLFQELMVKPDLTFNAVWVQESLSSDDVEAMQLAAIQKPEQMTFTSRHSENRESYLTFRNFLLICLAGSLFVSGILLFLFFGLERRYRKSTAKDNEICERLGMDRSLIRKLFEWPSGKMLSAAALLIFAGGCMISIGADTSLTYFLHHGFPLLSSIRLTMRSVFLYKMPWMILTAAVFAYTLAVSIVRKRAHNQKKGLPHH